MVYRSMMLGLVALVVTVTLGLAHAQQQLELPSEVVYRMTIRDFLPSHCLNTTEYEEAWESANYRGASDALYQTGSLAGLTGNSATFNLVDQRYSTAVRNLIDAENYCPYFPNMIAAAQGRDDITPVSAHPDFEAAFKDFVGGPSRCFLGGAAQTCAGIDSVIAPSMVEQPSGIPKVVYCDVTDPLARCGRSTDPNRNQYTTSRSKYFAAWFNDNALYNKRVGFELVLDKQSNDQFIFDSGSEGFFPLDGFPAVSEDDFRDPADAPLWPSFLVDITPRSELHSHFEYNGDEVFEFSGDDDVWVLINRKIAVDLGGLHGPQGQRIVLKDHAEDLGLEVGKVFELDMFHAERHFSGSNFKITSTLSTACNVGRSGTVVFDAASATASDVFLARGSTVRTGAGGALEVAITSAASTPAFASTHAYQAVQHNVGAGFITTFTFEASQAVEGFAFVAQARPEGLLDMPASTGAGLGFRKLTNSIAVVFDFCADRADADSACVAQDVRLHYPNAPDGFNGPEEATMQKFDPVMRNLRLDGETHTVRIEYLQTPDWLEVYIDDSLYLRQQFFTIQDIMGARDAHLGFTSATGATVGDLTITDWTITSVLVNAATSELLATKPESDIGGSDGSDGNDTDVTEGSGQVIFADGLQAAEFTVQTRDLCNNTITNGGFKDFLNGFLVGQDEVDDGENDGTRRRRALANSSVILPMDIVDNLDGTYTAKATSEVAGSYSLVLCFGENCNFDENLEPTLGPDEAFSVVVEDALVVLEVTDAPTASPTVFVPLEADNSQAVLLATSVGGALSGLFGCFACIALRKRRKWRNDKAFIGTGKEYNMEQNVTYDKHDEFAVVGRLVLASTQDILREKAQRTATPQDNAISNLHQENRELQEQLRMEKQNISQARVLGNRASRAFYNVKNSFAAPKKKEFSGGDYFGA